MAPIYYVLIAVIVVCVVILMVLVHAGFFYELQIRTATPSTLPRRVAYSMHTGPYKNAGSAFRNLGLLVPQLKTFGIYYDNPNVVPAEQLRYIVGCCLPDPPDASLEEKLTLNGYSVWNFPPVSEAVVTEFPLRSMLSLFIAPSRVYPALSSYCKRFDLKHVGPWIELCNEDCIKYVGPLEHQDRFFVPEVSRGTTGEEESKKQQ